MLAKIKVHEGTLLDLGFLRMIFYGCFYWATLGRLSNAIYLVPESLWQPDMVMQFFPMPKETWYPAVYGLWLVSLFLSGVGFLTRLSTMFCAVIGWYICGVHESFGHNWTYFQMFVIGSFVLALSPCGYRFSIDTWLSKPSQSPNEKIVWYTFFLMRVAFVLLFFFGGISKIWNAGLGWISADTLRGYVVESLFLSADTQRSILEMFVIKKILQLPELAYVLAFLTLVLELAAPAALLSRKARHFIIPALALLQIGILLTLKLNFLSYVCFYLFWYPPSFFGRPRSTT